jgi:protein SCO1/2
MGSQGNDLPSDPVRAADLPAPLREVDFVQRLGESIPLDATFRDETGATVALGDLLQGKPAILSLVYYECPMLCNMTLNGLTGALEMLDFDAGREFQVLTVSFEPKETPELARAKKENYLKRYDRPTAEAGWHFLTGDAESIRRLTDAVGFKYVWDAKANQYAHAAGIVVVTPQGRIARYFYGVEYPPKDLRLGLVEAADGKIGNLVDRLLLYCFHYDPTTGKYGAAVMRLVRAGAVLVIVGLGAFLLLALRREKKHIAAVGN